MKGKERYSIWLILGIFCVFVILPCAGYGATLTIGDTVSTTGNWTVNGNINATSFSGDGSGLTNLPGTGEPSSLFKVYDANNQFLGYSRSFPTGDSGSFSYNGSSPPTWKYPTFSPPSVRIPELEREVVFYMTGALGDVMGGTVYYTSTDCSGTAYGATITSYQILSYWNGQQAVYYTGQEASQGVFIQSYQNANQGCNAQGPLANPIYGWFVPLTQVTLPFNTPIALPLKFKVSGAN
jgi:hypothetical protein